MKSGFQTLERPASEYNPKPHQGKVVSKNNGTDLFRDAVIIDCPDSDLVQSLSDLSEARAPVNAGTTLEWEEITWHPTSIADNLARIESHLERNLSRHNLTLTTLQNKKSIKNKELLIEFTGSLLSHTQQASVLMQKTSHENVSLELSALQDSLDAYINQLDENNNKYLKNGFSELQNVAQSLVTLLSE